MPGTQQVAERRFLLAIRESFIALLPFLFVNSLMALIIALVDVWQPQWQQYQFYAWLTEFGGVLFSFFPLLAMLSLSFHFAKYLNLSAVVVASLSIGALIALHIHVGGASINTEGFSRFFGDPRAVILPIVMAYSLRFVMTIERLQFIKSTSLSGYLKLHLNILLPLIICFIVVTTGVWMLSEIAKMLLVPVMEQLGDASLTQQVFVRVLVTHILWCFGVHGDNAYLLVVGIDNGLQQILPNLTIAQFMDLFVLFGGSGATISLLIAIFWASEDRNSINVARISLPFSLFNINEILIYGLPVIFNPRLVLPFVMVPCINMLIGYVVVNQGLISFSGHDFPWVTPTILNGFIAGEGIGVVLLQLLLIGLGFFIYLPFVKRTQLLSGNASLDATMIKRVQLQHDIDKIAEQNYSQKQQQIIEHSRNLEKTIKEVLNGELLLYYQPKIDVEHNIAVGFEALLRLRNSEGNVVGPYFIEEFEQAGYSNLIDSFVINRLSEDMQKWHESGFYPKVSMNLNPNNIIEESILELLLDKLARYAKSIEIELLESAFMIDFDRIEHCIKRLRDVGFVILLDDFGTGFSSISLLSKVKIDGIKLDRTMLENIVNPKGRTLYSHTCMLCQSLGFTLIAEGVETKEEARFVKLAGVDYVQGWLYAKALPREEAKRYMILSQQLGTQPEAADHYHQQ